MIWVGILIGLIVGLFISAIVYLKIGKSRVAYAKARAAEGVIEHFYDKIVVKDDASLAEEHEEHKAKEEMHEDTLNFSEGDACLILENVHDIKKFLTLQGKSLVPDGVNVGDIKLDDEFFVYLFLKNYLNHLKSEDKETWDKMEEERERKVLDEIREETYEDFNDVA